MFHLAKAQAPLHPWLSDFEEMQWILCNTSSAFGMFFVNVWLNCLMNSIASQILVPAQGIGDPLALP